VKKSVVFAARVWRIGGSLAVVIPKREREELGLEEGDYVRVEISKIE